MWVADVSDNNPENIAGIINDNDAIIIKATEGNYMVNEFLTSQTNQVKASSKPYAFYHFINGGVDVKEQAQFFLDNAAPECFDENVALILDFENSNRTGYPHLTGYEPKVFADYIYEKTGKRIWLYIGHSDIIGGEYTWDDMKDYPLWMAGYPLNNGAPYSAELEQWADENYFKNLPYWNTVTMWQYDSEPYDRSIFWGDVNTWNLLAQPVSQQPTPQPTPQPMPQPESETPKQEYQSESSQPSKNSGIDENTKSEIRDLALAIADKTK